MTPTDIFDAAKWLLGVVFAVIAFLLRRELDRVGSDLAGKADKEQMQREIEGLKMELKESREVRERDLERLERTSAEKFAEFTASVRDRLSAMERNMEGKLDMIVTLINQIRKE